MNTFNYQPSNPEGVAFTLIEVIRIQEAQQKRCERTGLRQFQIWAVERCDGKRFDGGKPSTVAAVQKIP